MPTSKQPQDHRFINGIDIKKRIISDVKAYTETQCDMPRLLSILIGDVPEAAVYVRNQVRGAEQAGLPFEQRD